MTKKLLISGFIVITIILSAYFIFFNKPKLKDNSVENEINNNEKIQENSEVENLPINEEIIDQDDSIIIDDPGNKNDNSNDKKETKKQEDKSTSNNSTNNNNNNSNNANSNNNDNNQTTIPPEQPKVDEELEKAKSRVEYSNFEECQAKGFDISFKDPNLLGFSCPYIAYKGQILGYRLQLDYTNPMDN